MDEQETIGQEMTDEVPEYDSDTQQETTDGEDNPNEQSQDEQQADSDESETPDEEPDADERGDDEYEDEETFLSKHNLPGSPKTVEDLIQSHKALLKKLNEQPQREQVQQTPIQLQGERYFQLNPMSKHVDELAKSGFYASVPPEQVEQIKASAKFIDSAMAPLIDRMEGMNAAVWKALSYAREQSWKRFQYKNLVDRGQLDPILDRLGELDYDVALQFMAVKNPSLLKEFAKREQQRGAEKQRTKKLARFSGIRRAQKPARDDQKVYARFLGPDGGLDERKLSTMVDPTGERKLKIVDAYLADHGQKRE